MNSTFPVEELSREMFFRAHPSALIARSSVDDPFVLRFACFAPITAYNSHHFHSAEKRRRFDVPKPVHRFEELIAGHPYLIEVASVAADRWRAYIVRTPGVPTALMPFYGATPDEAAGQLRRWLTDAHERAAAGARGA